jgi:hypothetical protein
MPLYFFARVLRKGNKLGRGEDENEKIIFNWFCVLVIRIGWMLHQDRK